MPHDKFSHPQNAHLLSQVYKLDLKSRCVISRIFWYQNQLEQRLTAVERYQNRPFLIFTNIDIPADSNVLAPILQIVNNILQVSLNPDEISIAHPLKNGNIAPINVQFLYLQQRDIILKRASWLRGL